jgi:hypothetical protein
MIGKGEQTSNGFELPCQGLVRCGPVGIRTMVAPVRPSGLFSATAEGAYRTFYCIFMPETAALREYYVAMQDTKCCYANKSLVLGIWYT